MFKTVDGGWGAGVSGFWNGFSTDFLVSIGGNGKRYAMRANARPKTPKTMGKIVDQSPDMTRSVLRIQTCPPAARQSKAMKPMTRRIQKLLVRFGFCSGG